MKFVSSCLNMLLKCFESFIVNFVAKSVGVRPSSVKVKSIKFTQHIRVTYIHTYIRGSVSIDWNPGLPGSDKNVSQRSFSS